MKNIISKNIFFVAALAACLTSCAVFQGKSTASQYADDTGITAQIKARFLQSDMLSAPSIHVETQNGVVQMSGFVSRQAQINEAQRIVSSLPGVRGIVNDIVIAPSKK